MKLFHFQIWAVWVFITSSKNYVILVGATLFFNCGQLQKIPHFSNILLLQNCYLSQMSTKKHEIFHWQTQHNLTDMLNYDLKHDLNNKLNHKVRQYLIIHLQHHLSLKFLNELNLVCKNISSWQSDLSFVIIKLIKMEMQFEVVNEIVIEIYRLFWCLFDA